MISIRINLHLTILYFLWILFFRVFCRITECLNFPIWLNSTHLLFLLAWVLIRLVDKIVGLFFQWYSALRFSLSRFAFLSHSFIRRFLIFWGTSNIWQSFHEFLVFKMSPTFWIKKHLTHVFFGGLVIYVIISLVIISLWQRLSRPSFLSLVDILIVSSFHSFLVGFSMRIVVVHRGFVASRSLTVNITLSPFKYFKFIVLYSLLLISLLFICLSEVSWPYHVFSLVSFFTLHPQSINAIFISVTASA